MQLRRGVGLRERAVAAGDDRGQGAPHGIGQAARTQAGAGHQVHLTVSRLRQLQRDRIVEHVADRHRPENFAGEARRLRYDEIDLIANGHDGAMRPARLGALHAGVD